jgi:transcriptional regulator with XRE-family HTH domain
MSESIGAALRTGREQRHLTLPQVSEATRIRVQYLQALENDDLSAMTSSAQARGFMRIYAQFLELDLASLIPPPAAAPAADAPNTPAKAPPPVPSIAAPEPEAGDAAPGLLTILRARLVRRLGLKSPADEPDASAESTPEPKSEGKKKALP